MLPSYLVIHYIRIRACTNTYASMSRPTLQFLRPYLNRGLQPTVKPKLAHAYCAFQKRFAQTIAADAYTGRHDVEKQKRLEQLRKMKPLGEYHPRLVHHANGEHISLKDFHAQYEELPANSDDRVSVFGTIGFSCHMKQSVDNVRQS
jgi:lysyl-tRNA synthetase class 2